MVAINGDKIMRSLRITLVTGLLLSVSFPVYSDSNTVPYPDNYRSWHHVKSMIIQDGHPLAATDQGMHHIYANEDAIRGLRTGHYADGATLVYDLLEYVEKDRTIQEGSRKFVGVMYKNIEKYSDTGGWRFEEFAGNSRERRLTKDGGKSCFSCHKPKKSEGYVFF